MTLKQLRELLNKGSNGFGNLGDEDRPVVVEGPGIFDIESVEFQSTQVVIFLKEDCDD